MRRTQPTMKTMFIVFIGRLYLVDFQGSFNA